MSKLAVRFSIVEDDKEICELLAEILEAEGGFTCTAKYHTLDDARLGLAKSPPDVALVDLGLGNKSGIDLIRELNPKLPNTQFLVITIFEENERVIESLKAGANGYILKGASPAEYVQAVKILLAGGSPLSPPIARQLVNSFQQPDSAAKASLTSREREIIDLLATGKMYKQVAENLNVSLDTVRTHIRHIYEKLQVNSRTEALNRLYGRN
jgi:DNA-binding NarL/FixJ family response regulator